MTLEGRIDLGAIACSLKGGDANDPKEDEDEESEGENFHFWMYLTGLPAAMMGKENDFSSILNLRMAGSSSSGQSGKNFDVKPFTFSARTWTLQVRSSQWGWGQVARMRRPLSR